MTIQSDTRVSSKLETRVGMRPKISVAIAVFNGEAFIGCQLKSILDQSISVDEIIVSDDGSTDNSVTLITGILAESKISYRVVKNKYQRGFSNNFQSALENCAGDIIFLCDQDDYWLREKVEICVDFMREKNAGLVLHDMYIGDLNLRVKEKSIVELFIRSKISLDCYASGCSMVISKKLLNYALPFPVRIKNHDVWINEICKLIKTRYVVLDKLSIYRRHGSNFSNSRIYGGTHFSDLYASFRDQRSGRFFFEREAMLDELIRRSLLIGSNQFERADVVALEDELEYLRKRINLKSMNFFKRLYHGGVLYLSGVIMFRHAIKDVIIGFSR